MKLLITSALLLILSTVTVGSAVYDVTGEPLKLLTYYHITSAFRGAGGGGLFPVRGPQPCPYHVWGCSLNVAQSPHDTDFGLPVIFYPYNFDEKTVQLKSDVQIEFNYTLAPRELTTWQLETAEMSTGHPRYVTIGGDPTPTNDKNKWFKIEKAGDSAYKLMFCPSLPLSDTCGYLGLTIDNGGRWLSLSDKPLFVVFRKAEIPGEISLVTE